MANDAKDVESSSGTDIALVGIGALVIVAILALFVHRWVKHNSVDKERTTNSYLDIPPTVKIEGVLPHTRRPNNVQQPPEHQQNTSKYFNHQQRDNGISSISEDNEETYTEKYYRSESGQPSFRNFRQSDQSEYLEYQTEKPLSSQQFDSLVMERNPSLYSEDLSVYSDGEYQDASLSGDHSMYYEDASNHFVLYKIDHDGYEFK